MCVRDSRTCLIMPIVLFLTVPAFSLQCVPADYDSVSGIVNFANPGMQPRRVAVYIIMYITCLPHPISNAYCWPLVVLCTDGLYKRTITGDSLCLPVTELVIVQPCHPEQLAIGHFIIVFQLHPCRCWYGRL